MRPKRWSRVRVKRRVGHIRGEASDRQAISCRSSSACESSLIQPCGLSPRQSLFQRSCGGDAELTSGCRSFFGRLNFLANSPELDRYEGSSGGRFASTVSCYVSVSRRPGLFAFEQLRNDDASRRCSGSSRVCLRSRRRERSPARCVCVLRILQVLRFHFRGGRSRSSHRGRCVIRNRHLLENRWQFSLGYLFRWPLFSRY